MPKILLVEDNETNRDMLSRRLLRRGYEVVLAVDGEGGLDLAGTGAPNLILMDMSLPVLDGWEASRRLKADPVTSHIPIIALTAHAMSGDREKALEAGCNDYDTKPIEMTRLLLKIEALLAKTCAGDTIVNSPEAINAVKILDEPLSPNSLSDGELPVKDNLSADLLHDLRTPLNQIIGYSEMLAEQVHEDGHGGYVPDLEKIRVAGRNLLTLINNSFRSTDLLMPGEMRNRDASRNGHAPCPPRTASSPGASMDDRPLSAGGLILVVDDNAPNRDVLSRRLKRQGHRVIAVESGIIALSALREQSFDLVLLDIMMPDMDGFEVLKQLKADTAQRHIPVVMISASSEMESVVRCIDLGADDYLCKPFDPPILNARVEACLEKKRARDRETGLYEQLQVNYRKLQELEKLRDDLTSMIVHDLRTPLTSILVGMRSLEAVGTLNEDQIEMSGIAIDGGETLLGMINDLLDIDKLESGSMPIEYAALSVAHLVDSAAAQVESLAAGKQLTISRKVAADMPPLQADESKLCRVLVNLLGNAIKFTPAGGTVTVEAHTSSDGKSLEFAVSDTGEGIPPDALETIFKKFGQVATRKGGRTMSTGLGLAFCKLAVEAHGGRIVVESAPGEGSTFSVTLPLLRPVAHCL